MAIISCCVTSGHIISTTRPGVASIMSISRRADIALCKSLDFLRSCAMVRLDAVGIMVVSSMAAGVEPSAAGSGVRILPFSGSTTPPLALANALTNPGGVSLMSMAPAVPRSTSTPLAKEESMILKASPSSPPWATEGVAFFPAFVLALFLSGPSLSAALAVALGDVAALRRADSRLVRSLLPHTTSLAYSASSFFWRARRAAVSRGGCGGSKPSSPKSSTTLGGGGAPGPTLGRGFRGKTAPCAFLTNASTPPASVSQMS
mmetsp:Transcript_6855/g.20462  ORF Transcript_6855/g.20462 Transcript_6855/m.20462 type:complete len:261 (+) Transcript_6855:5550-6332(+)